MASKTTADQIAEAVTMYADFHKVEEGAVDVTRVYDGDTDTVVRFRLSLDVDGRSRGCDEWHDVAAPTVTLKTGGRHRVEVVESTVRDVKPADVGYADESWFVARTSGGRWVTLSDMADQDPEYHDTEEEASASWADAADVHRSVRSEGE